jgi:DNA-cytosine methyltransferase
MSELLRLLCAAVETRSTESSVGLLLSGGIDSISAGLACEAVGKEIQAYTFEVQGFRSQDREKAEAIARHFGWPLRVLTVPTVDVRADFLRLAIEHGCDRKVQFEVLCPLLYVFPEIKEREIWTGFNADDNYGNTRTIMLDQARLRREGVSPIERKRQFDEYRRNLFEEFEAPGSSDTWWPSDRLANKLGKRLLDPYLDLRIREYLSQFDHDALSPLKKPLIREALAEPLKGLPDSWIAAGVRLQIGGGVDALFRTLLQEPKINRFETKYSTVSALCQRWAQEVRKDVSRFRAELAGLRPPPRAAIRISRVEEYRPYSIEEVRQASSAQLFTVVATFAGGGGSSAGYRLAGGRVLLANDFVPEAARTYRKNFPDCRVDERDIRLITASEETVDAFLASAGLKRGELDMLDGSPPCSEFSMAGKGIKEQEVLRPYSDVQQKNIATLPFDFVDLAVMARPKVVIMENVPALASRGKEVFERVLRALRFPSGEDSGRAYYVNSSVLAASDYGVPQKRLRLFIVGARRDVAEAIGIDRDEAVLGIFPAPTKIGVSIRSAFANLHQTASDIEPWARAAMTTSLGGLIRRLPKDPVKHTRLVHIDPSNTANYTLTRCAWGLPAPTMVVASQRPDGMTGVVHPERDRKFTLPELKRLTALPDDFVLTGMLSQAAERVCRMVPPLLTKALAESVYTKVLLPYAEKRK